MEHTSGELIAGRYNVESELGRGGMGIVLRARDNRLDRLVALKMVRTDITVDPRLRRDLATEARIASALSHPGIAAVYDFVEDDGGTFIVCEYVSGHTLRHELTSGCYNAEDIIDAAVQLADAIATAHELGIVHRDLKPENIMVTPTGEGRGRVKILDFGLARRAPKPLTRGELAEAETILNSTLPGVMAGTVAYMAPEQLAGEPADARSDIYALGLILFEMATGTHPFRGESPSSTIANVLKMETPSLVERNPAIPPEFGRIVTKCLRKSPIERYQTARDLLTDAANLRRDFAGASHRRAPQNTERSLFHGFVAFTGGGAYRRWEILHIRICLKCVLLVYLIWRFQTSAPGTWGLIMALSGVVTTTAVYGLSAVLLYTGATDRRNLGREIERLNPWIRSAACTTAVVTCAMGITIAVSHLILAAFLIILGATLAGSIVVFKPGVDRAALSPPE